MAPFADAGSLPAGSQRSCAGGDRWSRGPEALVDARTRDRQDDDPARHARVRQQVESQLSLQYFQQEIRVGYEATLRRYRNAMEGIYNAVDPTEEQRAAMREILVDHIRTTQLAATPEQRRCRLVRERRRLRPP